MPIRNIVIGQPTSTAIRARAKELRRDMTTAEQVLWGALRANRLNGLHFRRQQVIGSYIVDFYCHAAALAIEVDGPIHQEQVMEDQQRQAALLELGVSTIRFPNEAVIHSLPEVLAQIEHACATRGGTPSTQES